MADIKGHFDGKKVVLLEQPPTKTPCRVTVSFEGVSRIPKTLKEVLQECGFWDDERSAEEIVEELYRLRRSRSSEVKL